jgi:sulfite reductase (ferredoxin)
MIAQRLGTFVEPDRVPAVWRGVTELFRDYGYRRLRNRARLKFLVADWGVERFREVLEKEYLGYALPDGPPPPPPASARRDHIGVTACKDGTFAVGFAPRAGRMSGTKLAQVADLADRFGNGEVRNTIEQKMIILGVTDTDGLTAALAELDLVVQASGFRRGTMACTGLEFCKLAIVETKGRASELIDELERRMPDFDEPIGINLNGCPNACARFQVADIGLKGMLIGGEDGFQVHLGGSMGQEAALGRKVRGLKVTAKELPDYIERMLRRYQDQRADGETFSSWVRRADEALLT